MKRFLVCLLWLSLHACGDTPAPAPRDGKTLDGMELNAQHRWMLKAADEAMRKRDARMLHMVRVWTTERAQVHLLEPHELSTVDIALGCLNGTRRDGEAALQAVANNKLKAKALELCADGKAR